jgi:glutamate/tyrosine decarboxylase-like PLP-dependent enzyme
VEDLDTLLQTTARHIARYRKALPGARVAPIATLDELIAGFDRPLTDESVPAAQVIDELVRAASPGLVASAGPRYFGFVTGGSVDAALCADLLTVGWDQLAFNAVTSPAAVAAEVVAGRWVKELLGLPAHASVGFVTGGQAANTAGLAAGRQHVLAHIGWDVARDGLAGAPRVRVLVGEERHATVDRAVRLLGLGARAIEPVAVDAQGAIDIRELEQALARDAGTPTIVCAQAGNVASGAFDDLRAVCRLARARGAWVHVDGAFGLWAAAS